MSWRAQIQNVRTQWNPRSSDGTLRSRRGVPAQSQRSGLCGERTSNEVSEPCRMRQGERYEVCEDALKGLGCCPARKSKILYRRYLDALLAKYDGSSKAKMQRGPLMPCLPSMNQTWQAILFAARKPIAEVSHEASTCFLCHHNFSKIFGPTPTSPLKNVH